MDFVKRAKKEFNRDVYMVLGGMHLSRHSAEDVQRIIAELKALGVQKAAPTHCTGRKAIALFKESFEDDVIKIGVGRALSSD